MHTHVRTAAMGSSLAFAAAYQTPLAYCDAPSDWQLLFQDPATPLSAGVQNLHHDLMFFIWFIAGFTCWMLFRTLYHFQAANVRRPSRTVHGTTLEIIWTITPSVILMIIAVPSFALLYSLEEIIDPAITIKVVGHQWYWSYEYSDYAGDGEDGEGIAFDSYMVPEDELEPGQLRLLEVDNRIVVPTGTHIRFLLTAADVIHAFAVPSLGLKLDAMPGRLNQTTIFVQRPGTFYGQCSEICGVNHAFMPICVEAVSLEDYVAWIAEKSEA